MTCEVSPFLCWRAPWFLNVAHDAGAQPGHPWQPDDSADQSMQSSFGVRYEVGRGRSNINTDNNNNTNNIAWLLHRNDLKRCLVAHRRHR